MNFIHRLKKRGINQDTTQVNFIAEFNNALTNLKSRNKIEVDEAVQFLDKVAFNFQVSFNYKRIALENLLTKIEYNKVADKVKILIQNTHDVHHKREIVDIAKRYRKVEPDKKPPVLGAQFSVLWKNGRLKEAIEVIVSLLTEDTEADKDKELARTQMKLNCIHTMIYDCYNPEQKEIIAKALDPIYTFLQNAAISYASVRDVLIRIFCIRNITLQEANTRIFKEHMDIWASSLDTYTAGLRNTKFYVINKAWNWICDAIEFARPAGKEVLWTYLTTWITEPPFNEELPPREKYKYQFFACEFLLQSFRTVEQNTATNFLLGIAESNEYSTFVRGDALDVLLRNPIPLEYRDRMNAIRDQLRTIREDTERNLRMQATELRQIANNINVPQFEDAIAGTTYDDSQNVHATEVNEAIKESLLNMEKDTPIRGNTIYKVTDDITEMIDQLTSQENNRTTHDQRIKAKEALTRFIEDPAVFTEKRLKLGSVLVLIWNRIIRHQEAEELHQRLVEELAEAFNTCATGHLSRAVSILVGYYPDIKQCTGFETQLSNNIKARINAAVRKAPEDLQGDIFIAMADKECEEYKTYLQFLEHLRDPIYKELYDDFVPEYMSKDTFDIIFSEEWPH